MLDEISAYKVDENFIYVWNFYVIQTIIEGFG